MYYFNYIRVSTNKQVNRISPEMQKDEARKYIEKYNNENKENVELIVKEELGYSAKKGSVRPIYNEMLHFAINDNKCLGIIVYSISRAGRSVRQLVNDIDFLEKYNKNLILIKENFDRTTPTGRLMFNIMASFAEFEIEQTKERLADGLATYKKNHGKIGRNKINIINLDYIKQEYKMGQSINYLSKIAEYKQNNIMKRGISVPTLLNILKRENIYIF